MRKKNVTVLISLFFVGGLIYYLAQARQSEQPNLSSRTAEPQNLPAPTIQPARIPLLPPLGKDPLQANLLAAGDYLMRQQLANGELAYQVNILTGNRSSTPSYVRLMGGVSSLYTVCRVAANTIYCEAGDRSLNHYLSQVLTDARRFTGSCLYTNGACPLGGATITVEAIYKRWQATGTVMLYGHNLLSDAINMGYFITSMRKEDGGFYHAFDPHLAGTVDPYYFDPSFNGEGLAALLQLYEMTGNSFWLEQANDVRLFMLSQPVTEDHGYGYALVLLNRLDTPTLDELNYAEEMANLTNAGKIRSLNPSNSSLGTASKLELLAALSQVLHQAGKEPDWLAQDMQSFITFVQARQTPLNDCNFEIHKDLLLQYEGGVFNTCTDPSIRVDAVQHWVNGLLLYMEYLGLD